MSELIPLESDRLDPALGEIAAKHPDKSVRGASLYALAARVKVAAERDGSHEGCKAAEALLQRVAADFPDVRTYKGQNKKNAERLLGELRGAAALGLKAPETMGKTLDGLPFDLADHRGKVVVLAFSGHWCGPCVRMHRIEKELTEKYSGDRLAVIEINSDEPSRFENVRRKNKEDGLHWIVVADGPSGPLSQTWNVSEWPTFVVLDESHRIHRRETGYIGEKLKEWVDKCLKDPKSK
jgi:thiol-disulfide isomerase/thioredoxin